MLGIALPLLLLMLFGTNLWAEVSPYLDLNDNGYIDDSSPWQEDELLLPAYPEEQNLLVLDIAEPKRRFTYMIDSLSLRVGNDGVIRYTLVIESNRGVRNISFEGIRCEEKEYKIYAYGSRKGELKTVRKSKWQRIKLRPQYRKELYTTHLCDHIGEVQQPFQPEHIISTIKR